MTDRKQSFLLFFYYFQKQHPLCLDPLIIFSGKNLQSTWRGKHTLPNTCFGVSPNGWMTTDIFYEWFVQFTSEVTERPLLLVVYDGHLSHVSIKLIEQAISEDITLVKLPPHVTDLATPATGHLLFWSLKT